MSEQADTAQDDHPSPGTSAPVDEVGDSGTPVEDDGQGAAVVPQQLLRRGAEPPDTPSRTGIFVDVPSLRAHVGDLLRAYLGGYQVDGWGNITFTYEHARVFITVGMSPIGPQIGVYSITNLDVELTPELSAFLVTTNHGLGFGAFSFDPDNRAVWLRHSLLGTTLDAPELQTAVAAIASTAAHFDDLIRDRFGGRVFSEASSDVQEATHPPTPGASGYL